MQETIVKVHGLTKEYKRKRVLDEVTFSLQAGKIYGLIGRNGAGKTTLMRILLGVSFPSGGNFELPDMKGDLSLAGEKDMVEFRKRVGSLIESPSLYTSMSAKDNMIIHSKICGMKNLMSIDGLLEQVGLGDVGSKRVKNFSLGMKQRLAIAMSLINSPKLLVLDEPMNGLDPIGIVEIRNLLKKLYEENKISILISSHILSELYQLATDFIFIENGQVVKVIQHAVLEGQIKTEDKNLEDYYLELIGRRKNTRGEIDV